MILLPIQLQLLIKSFKQPTIDQFQQYIKQESHEVLFLPLQLINAAGIQFNNIEDMKEYLTIFINNFLSAAKITLSKEELEWYIFYLMLITYKNADVELYTEYINLPSLNTTNKVIQYIQYRIYIRILPTLYSMEISSDIINQHLDKVANTPSEIIELPNI